MDNSFDLANIKRRLRELEEYNDELEGRLMELEETNTKLSRDISLQQPQVIREKVIEKSKD